METRRISEDLSVAAQIRLEDLEAAAAAGYRSVISNRPDGESPDQPTYAEIAAAAEAAGLEARHIPVESGKVTEADAAAFGRALADLPGPTLAFCRTGTRSATLWSMDRLLNGAAMAEVLAAAKAAGYDMRDLAARLGGAAARAALPPTRSHDVVIVGGGAAGIAVASSLLARKPGLDVAIIEPSDIHYYQPGWTLVGAGIFEDVDTRKDMARLMPRGAHWIKAAVSAFEPERNVVLLDGCHVVAYRRLIVAPGLKLNWDGVEGLSETLGQNGVTSNYRYDLAPYTWELVKGLRSGRTLFTQPPMPIKCAGAPQKAMYLSADHWRRTGRLKDIEVAFHNAGGVLFGVKDYVPALMKYVERYDAALNFNENLVRIDGPGKTAWFERAGPDGGKELVEAGFDMIHVCPPQTAPDFVRVSPLADEAGWVDVDPETLRHRRHENVWSLGDAMNAPNAKTAAAARKQAPVVAANVLADIGGGKRVARYDGYGSCPLTVERGKIVLAEFGYGGKRLPSFPSWLIRDTEPSHLAWILKERILPPFYWQGMLRGKEWMVKPDLVD